MTRFYLYTVASHTDIYNSTKRALWCSCAATLHKLFKTKSSIRLANNKNKNVGNLMKIKNGKGTRSFSSSEMLRVSLETKHEMFLIVKFVWKKNYFRLNARLFINETLHATASRLSLLYRDMRNNRNIKFDNTRRRDITIVTLIKSRMTFVWYQRVKMKLRHASLA